MFEYTEYELQKRRHKQELVRNEFKTVGNYQIPLIRKQDIDLDTISLISFSDTKQDDKENAYKTVHFFTYDWLFEKVYDKASELAEKLKQYYALLSPDFRCLQICREHCRFTAYLRIGGAVRIGKALDCA